jgi:hypothetical protein
VLVRCGRCRRVLCRAVAVATAAAAAGHGPRVVLVDVRPYARYVADQGAAPSRRVHLACHRDCGARYTLRLDRWSGPVPFRWSRRQSITLGTDA